jgi:hypothetical protein
MRRRFHVFVRCLLGFTQHECEVWGCSGIREIGLPRCKRHRRVSQPEQSSGSGEGRT